MKLTVKLRVIGGFIITSLLLLIIGSASYFSLNSISQSTSEVNQVSIPALEQSAIMKSEFVLMSKLNQAAFYATSLSDLATLQQQFNVEKKTYENSYANLVKVVANDAVLKRAASNTNDVYASFTPIASQLFSTLQFSLQTQETINSDMSDLEDNADNMAMLILDFTDVRDVQRRFPKAYAAATSIETGINTLISSVIDLNRTASSSTAATLSNEISFRLEEINNQFSSIQTETAGQVNLVSELAEKVTNISKLLSSDNGIPQLKTQHLNSLAQATLLLSQTDEQTVIAMKSLDALLNQASTAAETIQQATEQSVSNAISMIFVVVILSILFSILIATLTVRSISIPLAKVNHILGVVASGDLTQKLDDSAKDEFGTLATNCNKVIQSLQALIQGIISRSTQLAAASEQTSAITMQTTHAIREQKSQVTQAATATTEMSSTAQGVLQSANDAVIVIRNADNETERVKGISLENKNIILQLSHEVDQASVVINKLHKDSASIGSILDVIRSIADQTNLLALNAAIEAARAGEQGRGFAVVADEVRSLASKTQASTQEIQAMIQVLQSGAHAAVEAMAKGKKQAENCVQKTEIATTALDSITDAVHSAHDRSEQISDAAKEQNQVSHEISKLLESIVSIAEETASGAEQTSESSHEVARLAEELRLSVAQFKV
ncbi:methyl-accepting chemotaxis protein [Rheinheimera salexigens]|uniref:Chemotaxis protein n=1 Tax=Rheinheimera salexigens TaxID=1628148 RepID=A0A1E7Q3C5_9GAMM|nr:methyl-accepting chemotaxis protein [Rheinheimera salexigens]OEY68626.1 chemotaxis protein [Rheinheimera salexigens]